MALLKAANQLSSADPETVKFEVSSRPLSETPGFQTAKNFLTFFGTSEVAGALYLLAWEGYRRFGHKPDFHGI